MTFATAASHFGPSAASPSTSAFTEGDGFGRVFQISVALRDQSLVSRQNRDASAAFFDSLARANSVPANAP